MATLFKGTVQRVLIKGKPPQQSRYIAYFYQKILLCLFVDSLPPLSQLPAIIGLISAIIVLLSPQFHVNVIIQCGAFCVYLLSLV